MCRMNPNAVSEEYLTLQKNIMEAQKQIKKKLEQELEFAIDKEELEKNIPVVPQLNSTPVPVKLYEDAVRKITEVLNESNEELSNDNKVLIESLTLEDLDEWINGAIKFDTEYFYKYSKDKEVSEWLPHFIAEQALRPFMQVIADACAPFIDEMEVMGSCPCCGEPSRIGKLKKDGQKILHCPRCESEWKQKRLQCVHCGNDKHENLFYINVEEEENTSIEVCKSCRNYLKLVKIDRQSRGKQAALLDLETIHLDFIAQDEGYGEEH